MTTQTMTAATRDDAEPEAKQRVQKYRVQFDLPPRSLERLNTLKVKTEASSLVEVLKSALRLYEAMIEETENGNEFLIRDKEGVVTPYRMFLS